MTVPDWLIWIALAAAGIYFSGIMIKSTLIWARTFRSEATVSIAEILAMRFRKSDASLIVNTLIRLNDAQIVDIGLADLENFYLAGGDLDNAISAIIYAKESRSLLEWRVVEAYSLAGRDVLKIITSAVQSGNKAELETFLK